MKRKLIYVFGILFLMVVLEIVSAAPLQIWRNQTSGANVSWIDNNGNWYALGNINISGIFSGNGSKLTDLNISALNMSAYVPYTGANQNVNLGNNNFSVNGSTLFVNTNNSRVGIGTATPQNKLNVIGDGNFTGLIYGNGSQLTGISFTDSFITNYSTFLTHIDWSKITNGSIWSWVMNGTIATTSYADAQNTSQTNAMTAQNTSQTNLITLNNVSTTTFITSNNVTLMQILNNGSYFNVVNGEPRWDANYSQFLLNNISLTNYIGSNNASVTNALATKLNINQWNATNTSYLKNTGDTATGNYTFDTNTLFIDATNDRVGIGTTSPGHLLTVAGGAQTISGQTTAARDVIYMTTAAGASTIGASYLGAHSYGTLALQTSSTDRIFIKADGSVGIGTTSPQNKLNVIGDGNFTGNLYSNGAQVLTSYSETDPKWTANYSGYNKANWDTAYTHTTLGGTSVHGDSFLLNTGDTSTGAIIINPAYAGNAYLQYMVAGTPIGILSSRNAIDGGTADDMGLYVYGANDLTFWTANNIRMTVKGDGKVGIGTTNPFEKLHVSGSILVNGTINATTDVCIQGGNCLSNITGIAGEPLWTGNVSIFNSSWLSTYNSTVNDSIKNYILSNNGSIVNYIGVVNTSMKNYVDSKGFGTGTLSGTGTAWYIPMWNGTNSLNNSGIYQLGSNIGIGTTGPLSKLSIGGVGHANYAIYANSSTDSGTGIYAASSGGGYGVYGVSVTHTGIAGLSTSGYGVTGSSTSNVGVYGYSGSGQGVKGEGDIGVLGTGSTYDFYAGTATGQSYFAGNVTVGKNISIEQNNRVCLEATCTKYITYNGTAVIIQG